MQDGSRNETSKHQRPRAGTCGRLVETRGNGEWERQRARRKNALRMTPPLRKAKARICLLHVTLMQAWSIPAGRDFEKLRLFANKRRSAHTKRPLFVPLADLLFPAAQSGAAVGRAPNPHGPHSTPHMGNGTHQWPRWERAAQIQRQNTKIPNPNIATLANSKHPAQAFDVPPPTLLRAMPV
jgi:hypothetical protein